MLVICRNGYNYASHYGVKSLIAIGILYIMISTEKNGTENHELKSIYFEQVVLEDAF